ncbi:MAG TPA: biopolymer transporter ExbD [Pirellulaceae bacterium]|nr:biopolymer transporter ExbD [Pirellulaceae bacterium]
MKLTRKKHKAEVPSVAMGDIAFNLLIFFVILAKAQDDSHLNWTPASSSKVESAGVSKVSVLINSENKLHLNGQPIGLSQLAPRIKELLGDSPAGDRVVLLKVHREAQALQFEPVIEAISEAGGDLVHILEEKAGGG